MNIEHFKNNNANIAIVHSDDKIIFDTQSALDMIMTVKYETDATKIVIDKNLICDEFFVLSTGIAGEIIQKFINYNFKVAVYGDYSQYTSKPLKDFIYESNNGNDLFFVASKEDAIQKLLNI